MGKRDDFGGSINSRYSTLFAKTRTSSGDIFDQKKLALLIGNESSILPTHFCLTRPKPAYGRQGLDWIAGPGYSLWCSQPTGGSN